MALTDTCPMPWGKYKGDDMEDVPASYLLFMYDNGGINDKQVLDYVEDNIEVLRKEKEGEL
jgi:uncharacterized protein (DUF3820 family)